MGDNDGKGHWRGGGRWREQSNDTGENTGTDQGSYGGRDTAASSQSAPRAASAQSGPGNGKGEDRRSYDRNPGTYKWLQNYRRMMNHMHNLAVKQVHEAVLAMEDAEQAFTAEPDQSTLEKLRVARIWAEDHPPQPPKNNDPPKKK